MSFHDKSTEWLWWALSNIYIKPKVPPFNAENMSVSLKSCAPEYDVVRLATPEHIG